MKEVLFICTGNTCRSPMAVGIFNSMVRENNLDAVARSSGISAVNGFPPSQNAIIACRENGIDISFFISHAVKPYDIESSDLIVVMTPLPAKILSELYINIDKDKLFIPNPPVSDPYGGNIDTYRKCFFELKTLCNEVINHLFL